MLGAEGKHDELFYVIATAVLSTMFCMTIILL